MEALTTLTAIVTVRARLMANRVFSTVTVAVILQEAVTLQTAVAIPAMAASTRRGSAKKDAELIQSVTNTRLEVFPQHPVGIAVIPFVPQTIESQTVVVGTLARQGGAKHRTFVIITLPVKFLAGRETAAWTKSAHQDFCLTISAVLRVAATPPYTRATTLTTTVTLVKLGSAWEQSITALTTALDGLGGPVTHKKQETVAIMKTMTVMGVLMELTRIVEHKRFMFTLKQTFSISTCTM